ncbi:nickel-dependent lactate racemase family protein [Desulfopila aestuarii]|uniref:Nickel-dependent lactate racemase n=1 Tax=Desulfopila aestuarii DSM 18488 TaxID=1121416 RepID=A0A1M7Y2W5_9BACT|nr:nickel-dependent lactate racemase [Desulfopila aestuarii]SHO46360.1 Nickel-dependent lactate racemase [Desulfopila aestuarii DSM 18488]
MKTELPCGRDTITLELPDLVRQISTHANTALANPADAVAAALVEPIGSLPLAKIAKGRKNACIVISDITRPVPNAVILPPILKTLEESGIATEDITILIATGMHRPNLGKELEAMVGPDIMNKYRIVNHYCQKREEMRTIAVIDGAPIEVNTHYLDADLKILTGLIEPHFYAGFSGGRKSILPGISSFETMTFMHSYRVISQLEKANCRIENNIFHDYSTEVTEKAGVDFIVNVVINKAREVTGVFAGHYDKAHRAGCQMVTEHAVTELDGEADLVITSAGGYPLDATFYQVSKCLISARDILKKDGTIMVLCGCEEGLGSEEFCTIMRTNPTPAAFDERHSDPKNFVIDQWCAQNIYQALDHAGKIYIFSPGLSDDDVARFGGIKVNDCQATINELLKDHTKVVVIPEGPYVVGKIRQ